jgi:eukaryotic-like serine/threonine-protein kinase
VLGEIDYIRGQHEESRNWLKQASKHFSKTPDPLGRGQCLVLLGLNELGANKATRAKQLIGEALDEFEKVGFRLGVAECEIAMGHLAHRGDALDVALEHAELARKMMQDLKNPRGEAACQRLLGMIAFDSSDLMRSREHALSASALYDQMGEPRGQVEASLLLAQVALATNNPVSGELIRACEAIGLVEAETRQHLALSKTWLLHVESKFDEASAELQLARVAFGDTQRTGDHARQLLARLSDLTWPKGPRSLIDTWRAELGGARREKKRESKPVASDA